MCILMYFAPGAQPIEKHLNNGCQNNPDGFGYAVISNDGDRILTGHSMDHDALIAEFLAVRAEHSENAAIFHARITTDGTSTLDNCHPFRVRNNPGMVLGHNGILPCRPSVGDTRSDTRILAEDVMMRRFPALDSAKTRRRFESWLGTGSKVVILTTDWDRYKSQAYIFNEGLGHWLDGDDSNGQGGRIWYSNYSHEDSYYSWSSRRSTYTGWPMTIGSPRAYGNAEYADADGTVGYAGYALICKNCGYVPRDCFCAGTLRTSWVPSWQARRLDPDTGREAYNCSGCHGIGTVNEFSCKCQVCDFMYCCDQPQASCQCWGPDGTGTADDEAIIERLTELAESSSAVADVLSRSVDAMARRELSDKPFDLDAAIRAYDADMLR